MRYNAKSITTETKKERLLLGSRCLSKVKEDEKEVTRYEARLGMNEDHNDATTILTSFRDCSCEGKGRGKSTNS